MSEPLALYRAVMGRLWEEERIRGQRQGRIAARLAGRRQGGGAGGGAGSARDMLKAASRESRAAVFKRIRSGGCRTRAGLGQQLAYVGDKAVYTYSTMTNPLRTGPVLDAAQQAEIVEAWAETWRGTTKLGFTSHLLLSFPVGVSVTRRGRSRSSGRGISSRAAITATAGITFWRCMTTGRTSTRISCSTTAAPRPGPGSLAGPRG